MRKSIIAGAIASGLGLLGMGVLGGVLAYAVWPLTAGMGGNPNDWQGDDVWPAMIGAGMLWGVCFPVAGLLDRGLSARGTAKALRWLAYGLVLWLGAMLIWGFLLATMDLAG